MRLPKRQPRIVAGVPIRRADLRKAQAPKAAGPAAPRDRFELRASAAELRAGKRVLLHEALPDRKMRPLSKVLGDPEVPSMSPGEIDVPAPVLAALEASKNVLVVAHVFPDGDAVGSAVGLARALRAAGKEATVCIDDPVLQGSIRAIGAPGEVKVASELPEAAFDTVVVLDVAQGARIGGAKARLAEADRVVVIDHHDTELDREELGVPPGAELATWVDREADATAMLTAAVAYDIVPKGVSSEVWRDTTLPMLAGMITDTGAFSQPGTSLRSLSVFKHLLNAHLRGQVGVVRDLLDYRVPQAAMDVLLGHGTRRDFSPEVEAKLEALAEQGLWPRFQIDKASPVALMSVPGPVMDVALEVARAEAPDTNAHDLRGALLTLLDRITPRHGLALLVMGVDRGGLQLSARSAAPGPAQQIAEAFGGGGHQRKAAARLEGEFGARLSEIESWADRWQLSSQLRLRGGNL